MPDDLIGTTRLHFEITAKLGEGGMGAVYRGRDTKVLASLNHPNIAAIYEVGCTSEFGPEARTSVG